jgi:colanic acid/amylovoran biosynthesis protein
MLAKRGREQSIYVSGRRLFPEKGGVLMDILLKAYTRLNVGDDLFISIITRRFPKARFVLDGEDSVGYKRFIKEIPNLDGFAGHSLTYRAMRRLGRAPRADRGIIRRFDAVVYIGGSIFMENTDDRTYENALLDEIAYCRDAGIPYHILSCNFGPYKTDGYIARMRRAFEMCAEVCFRDSASYERFADIPSARLAPDAAFSYGEPRPEVRRGTLAVVPISYEGRAEGAEYGRRYNKMLAERIREHTQSGGIAEIFCFCRFEGDCAAAEEIARLAGGNVRIRVYDGGLGELLEAYLSCERVIASRFHAVLLALKYKIPAQVLIYSEKTENLLKDLGVTAEAENKFTIFDIDEGYVKYSQKIWKKLDEMYEDFY